MQISSLSQDRLAHIPLCCKTQKLTLMFDSLKVSTKWAHVVSSGKNCSVQHEQSWSIRFYSICHVDIFSSEICALDSIQTKSNEEKLPQKCLKTKYWKKYETLFIITHN